MAKSKETFNKKDKERKRLKLKQDKKQKMEERKANKKNGNELEGMMAYLDENGNLTDIKPDPKRKKVFSLEEIQISIPKQEDMVDQFHTGVVAFFNDLKGFGFINDQSTQERVFFHVKDIEEELTESDKVRFLVERGPRGLNAVQVTKITGEQGQPPRQG